MVGTLCVLGGTGIRHVSSGSATPSLLQSSAIRLPERTGTAVKLSGLFEVRARRALSLSAVYRVLDAADLPSRWKRSERSRGEYCYRPTATNQQWHTDVMYVWVSCRYYFLVTFIDAFSRYVVHHRLLVDLNGAAMATELEAALAKAGKVRPRIVHDHGSEYVNRDMRQ